MGQRRKHYESRTMTRILLLHNQELDVHALRMASRRSGVPFLYECAATPDVFLRMLAHRPHAMVCMIEGIEDMSLEEIAERAGQACVPLLIVGGDTEQEREIMAGLSGRFAASCRRARLPWLPMLLERTVREAHSAAEREENLAAATEQLQQAAAQMRDVQKLAIIGRLTGSIVHEINNPLESITNLNYLLSMDPELPEHLRRYVQLADHELKRVTQITKQTLSFYREAEAPVRIDLSLLLEEVVALYGRRIREKQIEVTRRYDSDASVLVFPGEMRQVYANLVANAIEATERGGRIVLRIHRARRIANQCAVEGVRVLVSDSGAGMPQEVRRRLGQPFFTTKGQRGTGLGLWVSQAIVKRYNGEIQLRSSTAPRRRGTTFSIFLPLNLGPHAVESAASGSGSRGQKNTDLPIPLEGLRLRAGSS